MKYLKFDAFFVTIIFMSHLALFSQSNLEQGIKLFQDQAYEKAVEYFLADYDRNSKNAEVNFYLGRCYMMLRDYDQGVDYLEKAVELDEKNVMYHIRLGEALGAKAQQSNMFKAVWLASRVKEEFEKALELDPDDLGAQIACISFYIQAPSVMGGDLEKAKKIIHRTPPSQNRMAQSFLIDIAVKEENYQVAEEKFAWLDSTFNDSTDHYSFYNKYGYFLLKQKKYSKAIEMFKKQVDIAPDEANPYDSLGDGFRAAGMIPEAITNYQMAVKINPGLEISKKKLEELQK